MKDRYDAFVTATPAILAKTMSRLLRSRCSETKQVLLLWDYFPRAQYDARVLRGGKAGQSALEALERRVVSQFDLLCPMTEGSVEFARRYYRCADQIPLSVIPPWGSNLGLMKDDPRPLPLRFVWGGQFSARRALGDLLDVALGVQASEEDAQFILVGEGSMRKQVEATIENRNQRNIKVLNSCSRREYQELLTTCHYGLSFMEEASSPCFPSKIVDYCQAGLPIIASVETGSDLGQILEGAGCGSAVRAGDVQGLARLCLDAIRTYNEELWTEQSKKSRQFFDTELEVSTVASRLLSALSRI
jgi:hypothetical protein